MDSVFLFKHLKILKSWVTIEIEKLDCDCFNIFKNYFTKVMACNAAYQMHNSTRSLKWNKDKLRNLEKKIGVQMSPMLHMKKHPEE